MEICPKTKPAMDSENKTNLGSSMNGLIKQSQENLQIRTVSVIREAINSNRHVKDGNKHEIETRVHYCDRTRQNCKNREHKNIDVLHKKELSYASTTKSYKI